MRPMCFRAIPFLLRGPDQQRSHAPRQLTLARGRKLSDDVAMADHLTGVSVFVEVTRAGCFTAAAKRLGLTKSAVSKTITKLETRLSEKLFHRSTRQLSLTSAGEAYLASCSAALDILRDAKAMMQRGQQGTDAGTKWRFRLHACRGLRDSAFHIPGSGRRTVPRGSRSDGSAADQYGRSGGGTSGVSASGRALPSSDVRLRNFFLPTP